MAHICALTLKAVKLYFKKVVSSSVFLLLWYSVLMCSKLQYFGFRSRHIQFSNWLFLSFSSILRRHHVHCCGYDRENRLLYPRLHICHQHENENKLQHCLGLHGRDLIKNLWSSAQSCESLLILSSISIQTFLSLVALVIGLIITLVIIQWRQQYIVLFRTHPWTNKHITTITTTTTTILQIFAFTTTTTTTSIL